MHSRLSGIGTSKESIEYEPDTEESSKDTETRCREQTEVDQSRLENRHQTPEADEMGFCGLTFIH